MAEDKPYCELLTDMVMDEEKAVEDYKKLKTPDHPLIDGIIESIRTDELKHAELLKTIFRDKCLQRLKKDTEELIHQTEGDIIASLPPFAESLIEDKNKE